MFRFYKRPLLAAATSLIIALPMGWATAEQAAIPNSGAKPNPPQGMQLAPCGKREDVVKVLREKFGESPIGHGLANTGTMAEVFLGPKGTWTIVATTPTGMSCMVGAGQSWQSVVSRDDTI
jgi:hypothetical protein